jgi:outer membrane lipoprotein-sorting protein
MHRRIFSIGLALLGLAALAGLIVMRGPVGADAQGAPSPAGASLPSPSPSFSTVWMSTVSVERSGRHLDVAAQSITADVAGDMRVSQTWDAEGSVSETHVYDAATRTLTRAFDTGKGGIEYSRTTDVAPAPLFEYAGGAATVLRAALAEHDPALTVKSVTFLGRPAWTASYTRQGWRSTSVVDQATGLPLRYAFVNVKHPRTHRSIWRVVDLKVDVPADASTFAIDIPEGDKVEESDSHEHFAPVGELAAKAGYAPLLPGTLPAGTELAAASTQPDPWGPYTRLFPVPVPWVDFSRLPDRVTTLYYLRGFDRFVVQEWPLPGGIGNSTPAELDRRPRSFYRKTALTTGAFAGRTARTWLDGNRAGLYVQKRSFAVLVTGDLTRSDALALAGSLQQ